MRASAYPPTALHAITTHAAASATFRLLVALARKWVLDRRLTKLSSDAFCMPSDGLYTPCAWPRADFSIQVNGNSVGISQSTSSVVGTARASVIFLATGDLLVGLEQAHIDDTHHQQNAEDDGGGGARWSRAVVAKGALVSVNRQCARGSERPAGRQEPDHVESVEHPDAAQQQYQQDRGADDGQRDARYLLPPVGPVNVCGFMDAALDRAEV